MQRKLTDAKVKNAKPKPDGKQKTLAIDVYPDIGLSGARDKHTEARELLAEGIDPNEKKQATKQAEQVKHQDFTSTISHNAILTCWQVLKRTKLIE